jgi:hypothetical protein
MKPNQPTLILAVLASAFFIASCQKQVDELPQNESATRAQSNASGKMVPIKGTLITTHEILSSPPMFRQRITGLGQISHLGESKLVSLATLNMTTPPPFISTGTSIFNAANGDTFTTTHVGTVTPNGDGTMTVIINHTITGGTGRFEHATGRLVANTISNPSLPHGELRIEGNISY